MSDFSVQTQGFESVISRIKSLPEVAKDQVITDVIAYALPVIRAMQPPQKYVTRMEAYGQPFQTERQRRWFFWALDSGAIIVPYQRTGNMAAAWTAQRDGDRVLFTNTAPGASYVVGFIQSRHERLVGWKSILDILNGVLSFRSSSFRSTVMGAMQKAIRKISLG